MSRYEQKLYTDQRVKVIRDDVIPEYEGLCGYVLDVYHGSEIVTVLLDLARYPTPYNVRDLEALSEGT